MRIFFIEVTLPSLQKREKKKFWYPVIGYSRTFKTGWNNGVLFAGVNEIAIDFFGSYKLFASIHHELPKLDIKTKF